MEPLSISVLISQYLSYCEIEKGLDYKTIKAYKIDLLQFEDFIQCRDGGLSKDTLQSYLALLHNKYKVKSVKRKVASLKAFFNF